MNNLLIAIAVFIITVVGALFAVPHFIDWNSYRGIFEEEAKNVIGREVQVDGDVKLHLLPTPYFRLEKVRIADASATLNEAFFKADSLSIKLSIPPLFRGIVEAHEIEFQRPVLRLALDAKDGWNWQSFAQALSSAGYVPANVALSSLRIRDGVLALHGSDGAEYARLDGLSGELSAPALQGPYTFRGAFAFGGAKRDLRLATGLPEADGTVPFRLSLHLPETNSSYLINARAIDLMGKTRIKGELTARLPLPGRSLPKGAPRVAADSPDEDSKLDAREGFELKAAIEADAAGATLSDLAMTFEHGGKPQILAGTARASWRQALTVDLDLSSRWLDLDHLMGGAEGFAAVDGVARFAAWARALLPADGRAAARLAIEQANLGGEPIGPGKLRLTQASGKLAVEDLRVELPGGSHGGLKGDLSGPADAPSFEGHVSVRGASAARFAAWASGDKLALGATGDGAFELRAALKLDASQAAVSDLAANVAGTMLRGRVRYKRAARPELLVALEGPKLDMRGMVPAGSNLFDLFDRLAGAPFAKQTGATRADLDLRVKAGQLLTAARTYRDVSATLDMKGGNLKRLQLSLLGDDGFSLELEGAVDELASLPKGSLRGVIAAETVAGIAPLAELLGVPVAFRPGESRERALVPLRLAATLNLGSRAPTAADLLIDGEANAAAVRVNARFDGGSGGWRSGRSELTASIASADAAKLASLVLTGGVGAGRGDIARPGRLLIRANGVPADGLASVASLEAGDVGLNFQGRLRLVDTGAGVEGDVEVRAGNGTSLAALAGLAPPLRADNVPVSAKFKLTAEAGAVDIDKLALQVGATRLSGRVALSEAAGKRRIDANLSTDEIAVGGLLAPLLDQRFAVAGAAETLLQGGRSPWPDEPFSAFVLDGFEGQVRLASRRLTLAEGLTLDRAKLDAVLHPGMIEVKQIAGAGLGGQFKAAFSIATAPAGADVRGSLDFDNAQEELSGGPPPRASGPMRGTITFSGRGATPRAVISAMKGEGSVAFGEAKLAALWPGAIATAADAALKADTGKLAATVRQGLAAGLGAGSLPLKQTTLALEIADGQLRSKPLVVDTAQGRASGTARLDLSALTLDSLWRLETKSPDAGATGKPLPVVTVAYRGPIVSLGALAPQIDAAALEQELSARRIARDMDELDRLRRLEEERRVNEAERLRKQFEATPPIPRPPPQSVPVGPTKPPANPG
jgi:hypothetical protein